MLVWFALRLQYCKILAEGLVNCQLSEPSLGYRNGDEINTVTAPWSDLKLQNVLYPNNNWFGCPQVKISRNLDSNVNSNMFFVKKSDN